MRPADLRLYLVTSGTGPTVARVAAAVAAAGAGMVQVRAKGLSQTDLLALVLAVARAVAEVAPTARVVVNDSVPVTREAMARGAFVHGVHLGQDDGDVRAARRALGPDALIGLTTGTLELVRAAQRELVDVVDYLGAGPYRPTPTKASPRPPLGLAGYRPLVAATTLPVVAIGDVRVGDVAALAGTGVAGVCMVRELMTAPDPGLTAAAALREWQAGRRAASRAGSSGTG